MLLMGCPPAIVQDRAHILARPQQQYQDALVRFPDQTYVTLRGDARTTSLAPGSGLSFLPSKINYVQYAWLLSGDRGRAARN